MTGPLARRKWTPTPSRLAEAVTEALSASKPQNPSAKRRPAAPSRSHSATNCRLRHFPFGTLAGLQGISDNETLNDELRGTTDPDEAAQHLQELTPHMTDEAVSVPIVDAQPLLTHTDELANLSISALNEPRFDDAWLCEG